MFVPLWARRLLALNVFLVVSLAVGVWQFAFNGCALKMEKALPWCVLWLVPTDLRTIRDLDQLAIMVFYSVGFVVCMFLVIYIFRYDGFMVEGISLLVYIPCLYHVGILVHSYDDRAFSRRQEIARRHQEITQMYQSTLDDLAAKLEKVMESNVGQAEERFESKKRDFCSFVDWSTTQKFDAEAGEVLLRLLTQWLHRFGETSLDPINDPRVGGPPSWLEILESETAYPEKTKALKESVRQENVRFLASEQAALEQKKVLSLSLQEKASAWKQEVSASCPEAPSWVSCGRTGCGILQLPSQFRAEGDAFPCKIMAGCCEMSFIDLGHLTLTVGLLLLPGLCIAFVVDGIVGRWQGQQTSHVALISGLASTAVCLAIILFDFDRINVLMRLEEEMKQLDEEREKEVAQRVRITEFVDRAQGLVDFWLHRTLPWLDLFSELHERLRDALRAGTGDASQLIRRACAMIDKLDSSIGSAEEWRLAFQASCDASTRRRYKTFAAWVREQMAPGDFAALEGGIEGKLPELLLELPPASERMR